MLILGVVFVCQEIAQLKGETVQLKDAITKLSGESETVKQVVAIFAVFIQ